MTEPTRKENLIQRAKTLGISFSPNIGEDTLAQRIKEHMEKNANPIEELRAEDRPVRKLRRSMNDMLAMTQDEIAALPKQEREQVIRETQRHKHTRLLRCQVYCNNPHKADLHGDIFATGNRYIGTVKKYVPFGEATENGYHIPEILVKMMKGKKYQNVRSVKNPDGTTRVVRTLAPEFTINILPPLTKDELEELALKQAAAERVGV